MIIQSSVNDRLWSSDELARSMHKYLDSLPAGGPIVVTGAIWSGPEGLDSLTSINATSRAVAGNRGLVFLDTKDWFSTDQPDIATLFHADGHPTDLGHAAIAAKLLANFW